MKKILIPVFVSILILTLPRNNVVAQDSSDKTITNTDKHHQIVFQLSSEDSVVHKALMKQLNNILTAEPNSTIEIVCHGPGMGMLINGKTIVHEKIQQLKKRGVEFVVCEFSMSERKVTKDQIIPEAGFVKFGILEIIAKQEAGWSYIKSGF